jgi:hypothetical protein
LKLRSPAGSEPLVYKWPLQNRVSLSLKTSLEIVLLFGKEVVCKIYFSNSVLSI